MPQPITIDEVLAALDVIIDQSVANNNFSGIFAFVYRRTTAAIKDGIVNQSFEDNDRMEKFDVLFANLYLAAYEKFSKGEPTPAVWDVALKRNKEQLTILQHIILGMNAHINFDLAFAAAEISNGQNIEALAKDFDTVNDILFSIVDEMQDRLSKVSRLFFLLDWIGQNKDEKIIDFSMRKARSASWNNANLLWAAQETRPVVEQQIENLVVSLANSVIKPKTGLVRWIIKLVAQFEVKDVGRIIDGLRAN